MFNIIYRSVFLLFTIYILIESISYGIYEIKNEKNNIGGKVVIYFSIFSVIFSNIIIWQN